MAELTGSPLPISVAPGYEIQAPGLRGTVRVLSPRGEATRSAGGEFAQALSRALEREDIATEQLLELAVSAEPSAHDLGEAVRSGAVLGQTRRGKAALALTAPSYGAGVGYAALVTDESGLSRWYLPAEGGEGTASATRGGGGGGVRFLLPLGSASAPAAEVTTRGPLARFGRRLVRIVTWATDGWVGQRALDLAKVWEGRQRPYRLTRVDAAGEVGQEEEVPPAAWAGQRALLLLHGTFSTAGNAFGALLARPVFAQLAARYGGRVLAFEHPSLHHDPGENASRLLQRLPEGLELDVLCHSRGGLVCRELIHQSEGHARLRRAVLVAAPNEGTVLVDGDHDLDLIDRYTNLLVELPDNPISLTLEAALAALKIAAHGSLAALPGLRAMRPGGKYLRSLNAGAAGEAELYAVASDFRAQPSADGGSLLAHLADRFADGAFGEANDGVVPMQGGYGAGLAAAGFPLPPERRLELGHSPLHHLSYFDDREVDDALLLWLSTGNSALE